MEANEKCRDDKIYVPIYINKITTSADAEAVAVARLFNGLDFFPVSRSRIKKWFEETKTTWVGRSHLKRNAVFRCAKPYIQGL